MKLRHRAVAALGWAVGPILFLHQAATAEPVGLALVPMPKSVKLDTGTLPITASSRIVATDQSLMPLAAVLAADIERVAGLVLHPVVDATQAGDIVLRLDPALDGEAYELDVGTTADISAGNYHALAFATVTLLQAMQVDAAGASVPRVTISDAPAFPFRAALIDVARKYHTPAGIKQVVELCRLYKIRFLHIHLSDDQLFMFPSTAFPQVGRGNREFARFEPGSAPHIQPYTLAELRDLEQFSQERGVHIVPEIDLPGHSGRLVGDAPDTFAFPGNGTTVNIASPKTLAAIDTLMNEVMDVFQGTPFVHIGADEVGLGGLEQTADFREAQKQFGVKNAHDMYVKFVADLARTVNKRGKTPIVWEEGWNAEGMFPLPKDAIVMCWSHGRDPTAIVRAGYRVVNATWTPLYIVRDNKKTPEFLFAWDVPKFGRQGSEDFTVLPPNPLLLGAELCSWENSEAIEVQALRDRLAIVAEKAWNPTVAEDFVRFRQRLAHTDDILDKLVHPVTITITEGTLVRDEITFEAPITVSLTPKLKTGLKVRYTLDNSLPNDGWKTYAGPIALADTVHLRAGLFDDAGKQHGYLSGAWLKRVVAIQKNNATGKPVSTGPGPQRRGDYGPEIAVDGRADDVGRHWAAEQPGPEWLRIDLEQVVPVDFVNVITYHDGSRYYQLDVELSIDGEQWAKVAEFNDTIPATAAGYAKKFRATDARYVRINMTKNSANAYMHVVEVIVNGPTSDASR